MSCHVSSLSESSHALQTLPDHFVRLRSRFLHCRQTCQVARANWQHGAEACQRGLHEATQMEKGNPSRASSLVPFVETSGFSGMEKGRALR